MCAAGRLHESQRNCLRLVAQGMSTKEIARETGLSPASVDTYLKQANSILGASNRRDAARTLLRLETSQKSGSPPQALPNPVGLGPQITATGETSWRHWSRLPSVGGSDNDLSWQLKTLHILQIAVVSAAVVLALTLTIAGFLRLLR